MTVSCEYVDATLDQLSVIMKSVQAMGLDSWALLATAAAVGTGPRMLALQEADRLAAAADRQALLEHATGYVRRAAPAGCEAAGHALACALTAMLLTDLLPGETASLLLEPIRAAMTGARQARHSWLDDFRTKRPALVQTPADHT
jgi:hypothetical protein